MFKTVLVEDEINIRENIRDTFPWLKNRLIHTGEASDGESALQLIEDVKPQIVITDIKMPFLNGLELSRIIRQQMPWIKIIIMTGHDEFELAQQALKIGVSDYLLKPIGLLELESSIKKVIKEIEDEEINLQNIEKLQTEMEINKNYLKNDFLKDILAGALNLAKIYETAANLGIHLKASAYAVVLLRLGISDDLEGDPYGELIKAVSIINTLAEDPILLVRQSLKEHILIIKGNDADSIQNVCYRIGQSVKSEVESKTRALLSVYIGGAKKRLQELHHSCDEAMQTANLSYLFGANRIVGLDDLKMVNPYHGSLIPFERKELARFLRTGMREDIESFISQHQKRFASFPEDLFHLMLIKFNLHYEIAQFLEELGFYGKELRNSQDIPSFMVDCTNEYSVESILTQAKKSLVFAVEQRELCKVQKYDLLMEKAKAYIMENYDKSTLQLPDVAAHVNISTGHLSTIFNQENKISYTDYVTEVRIEKAKELMLNTDLRSAEIAYKVGYNDPHYFYNIFKKVTGMTSNAFRNRDNDGQD